MTLNRLSSCCFSICLALTVFSRAQAEDVRSRGNQAAQQEQKHIKLAGRASNEERYSNATARPLAFQQGPERKSLTFDERRALRRQINESESRYPQKN